MNHKDYTILGYSGHAYVVIEAALNLKLNLRGYCNPEEVKNNPFKLVYRGDESDSEAPIWRSDDVILLGIGNNDIRAKLGVEVLQRGLLLDEIIHPDANVSKYSSLGVGSFVARGACINPMVRIGRFVIVNTSAVIDHECSIADGVHIAPGAVLAGNVKVGRNTFIGANSVIKQGVSIGEHCIIGAGSVVLKDVQDHQTCVGNPARLIKRF